MTLPAAEEKGEKGPTPKAQPFIDPQAIAVVQLDLAKIDADALDSALRSELAAVKPEQFVQSVWERNVRHLTSRLKRLKELRVSEVYLVLTLYDLRAQINRLWREPEAFIYAVVPVSTEGVGLAVAQVFAEDPPHSGTARRTSDTPARRIVTRGNAPSESAWFSLHFHSATYMNDATHGNVVLAAPANVLEYLIKTKRDERASMKAALAAAGDGAFQFVVAPPPIFARAVEEVLGPAKVEGMSLGATISRGFQWGSLGMDTKNGEPTGRLVIQSRDAAGAEGMKRLIDAGLAAVHEPRAQQDGTFDQFAKLIDLQVSDGQLRWQIDGEHTPPTKVREALRPALLAQQVRLGTHQSMNNVKQIGLALLNMHSVYKAFPTPANYNKDGRPLLSWRVHILEYMPNTAENQLHREFRRDEPWDSEHNRKLIERMPAVYRRPFADPKTVKTPYQMPIGETTAFRPGKKVAVRDLRDGTSKTIGVVEVDPEHEVIWTKPDDWEVNWENPMKGLTGGPGGRFAVGFLDGSVYLIPKSIERDRLRAMLTGDGGDNVERAWYEAER
jgi:hypothetical protein